MIKRLFKAAEAFIYRHTKHHGQRHLLVAIGLSIITLSPSYGAAFYHGREHRDWEKLHDFAKGGFDHLGFWWPWLPLMALHVVGRVIIIWHVWKVWF